MLVRTYIFERFRSPMPRFSSPHRVAEKTRREVFSTHFFSYFTEKFDLNFIRFMLQVVSEFEDSIPFFF